MCVDKDHPLHHKTYHKEKPFDPLNMFFKSTCAKKDLFNLAPKIPAVSVATNVLFE